MTLQALKPHRVMLGKTEKAHAILSKTCAATLSLAERRILILTNGDRSLQELFDALGEAILPSVQHLVDEGYLVARPRTKVIDRLVLTPADKIGGLLRGKA